MQNLKKLLYRQLTQRDFEKAYQQYLCYFLKMRMGKIIYVGKAIDIKNAYWALLCKSSRKLSFQETAAIDFEFSLEVIIYSIITGRTP